MEKPKQLIFVVECDEDSRSDWNYIRKLLASSFFDMSIMSTWKLTPVFLGGKNNYCKKETEGLVQKHIGLFKGGKSLVFYAFDIDSGNKKNKAFRSSAKTYCSSLSYKPSLIWFNKDVEDVFLRKHVKSGDKKKAAIDFNNNGRIDCNSDTAYRLTREKPANSGQSNILYALSTCTPVSETFKKASRK